MLIRAFVHSFCMSNMQHKLAALLRRNRLLGTLLDLRGNARYCLLTEPMWGIPNTLYVPLVAKYMEALGLSALQIGVVLTANLLSQMVAAFMSGAVTDRLGRRRTTMLVDFIAWSLPCLLWMAAQGFAWFLAAALLNGLVSGKTGSKVSRDLRQNVFTKVLSFSGYELDQFSTASLITRSTADIRQIDHHLPVETAGTQKCRIQYFRTVCRRKKQQSLICIKSVHLS